MCFQLNEHNETFVDHFINICNKHSIKDAFVCLNNDGTENHRYSYDDLLKKAKALGAALLRSSANNQHVILLYENDINFIVALLGCMFAGAVAITCPFPQKNRVSERFLSILKNSQACYLLTTSELNKRLIETQYIQEYITEQNFVLTDNIEIELYNEWVRPEINENTIAFIQYTSGSISMPKGVLVSHKALMSNEYMMMVAYDHNEDTRYACWLPFFHDMGLIGHILQTLYLGAFCVLMTPNSFIFEPYRWLKVISDYKITSSGGPNFAFDLCAQKIDEKKKEDLNLRSWENIFNGAEPVKKHTIDQFIKYFSDCGLRETAMKPCYGLAEATLFSSGGKDYISKAININRKLFEQKIIKIESTDDNIYTIVCCGKPAIGQTISIINENEEKCNDKQIGEILLKGPNIADGYYNNIVETQKTFGNYINGDGPYLKTGDLGFIYNGELYVTGRSKDLIIIRGRNIYPQDIELTVEKSHPAIRKNTVAAFALEKNNEISVAVVCELGHTYKREDYKQVVHSIKESVSLEFGIDLYGISLLKPGRVNKTTSGKIQRQLCKQKFLLGDNETIYKYEGIYSNGNTDNIENERLNEIPKQECDEKIYKILSDLIDYPAYLIEDNRPLIQYGLDSIKAITFIHEIDATYNVEIALVYLLDNASIADVFQTIKNPPFKNLSQTCLENKYNNQIIPLSYEQKSMYYMQMLNPHSSAYTISKAFHIYATLDPIIFCKALIFLAERHPSLRMTISNEEKNFQLINNIETKIKFQYLDSFEWNQDKIKSFTQQTLDQPIKFNEELLYRHTLLKIKSNHYIYIINIHHIISDLWSLEIIIDELEKIVYALENRTDICLNPIMAGYSDYIVLSNNLINSNLGMEQLSYWKTKLNKEVVLSDFPFKKMGKHTKDKNGSVYTFTLEKDIVSKCNTIIQEMNCTNFMFYLAAYMVLLYFYTENNVVNVGTPVASGRRHKNFAGVIGCFINTVVLSINVLPEYTFIDILKNAKQAVLDAIRHQDYPFALLVEKLNPERQGDTPYFQTMFIMQNSHFKCKDGISSLLMELPGEKVKFGKWELESIAFDNPQAQFDMTVALSIDSGQYIASIGYNNDLYDHEAIQTMSMHMQTLLSEISVKSDLPISNLYYHKVQTNNEYTKIDIWQSSATNVIDLIYNEMVIRKKEIAIINGEHSLTYGELFEIVESVKKLLAELPAESLLCIYMKDTMMAITISIGVMASGCAFTIADYNLPKNRLADMIEQGSIMYLFTTQDEDLSWAPKNLKCINLNDESSKLVIKNKRQILTTQLACVVFTSGTTGKPKGVMINHLNLFNIISSFKKSYNPQPYDKLLSVSSPASASFIGEYLPMLCVGCKIVLPDKYDLINIERLSRLIEKEKVTIISSVSSFYKALRNHNKIFRDLRLVLSGGEELSINDVAAIPNHIELVNGYGLTETSVCSSYGRVVNRDDEWSYNVIGKPIINTNIYVLDEHMRMVPPGHTGELYIAGFGITRGYLNQPRLTAERYLPDPFRKGIMFKTGDKAKMLSDGSFYFIGRIDSQIQIRGHRVEMLDVRYAILKYPDVNDAAVGVDTDEKENKLLTAYIVVNDYKKFVLSEFITFLYAYLPSYMVPSKVKVVVKIPLNENLKINYIALKNMNDLITNLHKGEEPANKTERFIASIWCEMLNLSHINVNTNFFDAGGNSLLLIDVYDKLSSILSDDLQVVDLFKYPTIRALSDYIQNRNITNKDLYKEEAQKRVNAINKKRQLRNAN